MSAITDKISGHYDSLVALKPKIEVPEWDMVIYWLPLTLSQRTQIFTSKNADGECVFLKALDADGKRLFASPDDHHVLLHKADATIVERIAVAMMRSPTTVEDQLKN